MDVKSIHNFIDIAKKDKKAELECSVLPGIIQTKDTADRILSAIKTVSLGPPTETSLLRITYPDNIRVEVETPQQIQRVCSTASFKGVPVLVQRKTYYQGEKNIDLPDIYSRVRLRLEETIRKDWEASPNDPRVSSIRLLNRRSFTSIDEFFRIDLSMVKSRKDKKHSLRDVLREQHIYELEIEFVDRTTSVKSEVVTQSLFKIINTILQAYQQSEFLLTPTDQERYIQEFRMSKLAFYNPVTLERRTLKKERPHNIWSDYTVTVKADGERFGLYVARDKKVLRINKQNKVVWTGLRTIDDSYIGDFVDGEYIPQKNLFCIFDIYRYKGRDIHSLPLMKGDDPTQSRLGCASLFAKDISTKFITESTTNPIRIETKLFLAGDGKVMEESIQQLLNTEFEYQTDGLVFTPRLSPVAPKNVLKGSTWTTVYKWKPPHQNSIDFLLKLSNDQTYDPVQDTQVRKGELYVSRSSFDSILYPCETLTGEYVPKQLPSDLQKLADTNTYIPSLFQPSKPRDPEAYRILVPVDEKGLAFDEEANRVDDNTIIECSYNLEEQRWKVMRTRYDKTYEYRILNKYQYGNDRGVADNIWSSIHIPVTEEMISNFASIPVDDSQEDEVYYKEEMNRKARILQPSYEFHNKVKDGLYAAVVKDGSTLLEFGVGKAGDFPRWKRTRVGKVVGIDPATRGLKEACTRYLQDKEKNPSDYRPAVLFIQGSMTEPLYEQKSQKYKILSGAEKATTKYLEQFEDIKKFDSSSSQFNIHYACESEEVFRAFVKNIDTHTKESFFGTCLDGQTVYSLLMGKQTHIFTNGKDVGGEFSKEYDDKQTWVEEFGMPIKVSLESFDKPTKEYLVPFGKVTEIMKEHGFNLKESDMFSELYTRQTKFILTPEQQTYSFLNRTFVFVRGEKKEEEPPPPPPNDDAPPPAEEPAKKTRKLKKATDCPCEKPVLFSQPGEDKGEFRTFSNQAEYPIQINDIRYPSVEHYFQAQKAKEFGDEETYKKMLDTPSGKAVKALGKKVTNFHKEVWDAKRLEIMMRGVKAKFVQHPELQKQLLETGDRQIGEADARSSFWGIGTSENTDKSADPSKWKGQNRLGKILMALRDEFKSY
jgi:ribA/ribD-fused uncharacterized protein